MIKKMLMGIFALCFLLGVGCSKAEKKNPFDGIIIGSESEFDKGNSEQSTGGDKPSGDTPNEKPPNNENEGWTDFYE